MNIPKSFKIFGHTIKVKLTKDIAKHGAVGLYEHNANVIYIQTHLDGNPATESQMEHTFYHELTHCIFSHLNLWDDNQDERKVDTVGGCLHQALSTMKY
jgi:hypothetical protein